MQFTPSLRQICGPASLFVVILVTTWREAIVYLNILLILQNIQTNTTISTGHSQGINIYTNTFFNEPYSNGVNPDVLHFIARECTSISIVYCR